jgi:hypothetical protein
VLLPKVIDLRIRLGERLYAVSHFGPKGILVYEVAGTAGKDAVFAELVRPQVDLTDGDHLGMSSQNAIEKRRATATNACNVNDIYCGGTHRVSPKGWTVNKRSRL